MALQAMAARHAAEAGIEMKLEVGVRPPPLGGRTFHHLRMIVRESINNALRHASPTRVDIQLTIDEGKIVLRISDDGCGLDVNVETRGKPGHFGCIGMRERARKIQATIAWQSVRGRGTTVEVRMALRSALHDSGQHRTEMDEKEKAIAATATPHVDAATPTTIRI